MWVGFLEASSRILRGICVRRKVLGREGNDVVYMYGVSSLDYSENFGGSERGQRARNLNSHVRFHGCCVVSLDSYGIIYGT